MAYYASKSSIRRGKARRKSIAATGHYGGTTKAGRSKSGVLRTGGYSLYGGEGKGLSDVGYARWISKRAKEGKGTVVENPMSYLMGMAQLGKPVGWAGKPGYEGSLEQSYVKAEAAKAVSGMGVRTVTMGGGVPSQAAAKFKFGRGGLGGPKKGELERAEGIGGAGLGTVVAVGGIGYLLWLVLK